MITEAIKHSLHVLGSVVTSLGSSVSASISTAICAVPADPACLPVRDFIDRGEVDAALTLLHALRHHPASREAQSERLALSARLHLFASRTDAAERDATQSMMRCKPDTLLYRNAFYLRASARYAAGRFAEMRDDIANMRFLDHSNRFYRMVRLSIDDSTHRAFFMETYAHVAHQRHRSRVPYRLQERGRDRAYGQYILLLRNLSFDDEAMRFSVLRLANSRGDGHRQVRDPSSTRQPNVWQQLSKIALTDLKAVLDAANIPYFLIGGTLLGHVREGQLLAHDRDIDIGVDSTITREQITLALQQSAVFRLRPIVATHCIYAEHINGTLVDLFQHFMDEGAYCHQGLKTRWTNTPFDVKDIMFCGKQHCIPTQPERYLTENYGDWRTPNLAFETFLDTPNMRITHPLYFALHCLTGMNESYRRRDFQRFERLSDRYASLCENTPQLTTFRF